MQDIDGIVKHLKEQAKKRLEKRGGLTPKAYFLILYPGQNIPVYYPVDIERYVETRLKNLIPQYLQQVWIDKKRSSPEGIKLLAVCLIVLVWVSKEPGYKPIDDPNRIDCLQITVCTPGESQAYMVAYKRKGRKIEFIDKFNRGETAGPLREGWIAELFPKRL